ncbi:MAG TPA: EamA family transporter [Gemmatimonadaceae bacterium]|nr:EamA family transporter [Gemmatimonadaceae bacterium]
MLVILLALAASATYGIADFCGGLASRRAPAFTVATVALVAGLVALLVAVPFVTADAAPTTRDLMWGAASGAAGGVGVGLLYAALGMGRMSVVAPVTAVCGLAVPVLVGLALGERPSVPALAGVVLAAAAVVLISQGHETDADRPGANDARALVFSLASGVAIGAFYVCLQRTPPSAGLWPIVVARAVSVAGFVLVALVGRRPLTIARPTLWLVLVGGVIDTTANVLYLLAVRRGLLSVVATLASLYPASTVLLARLVLGERVRLVQAAGLAVAAVAVVLIGSG